MCARYKFVDNPKKSKQNLLENDMWKVIIHLSELQKFYSKVMKPTAVALIYLASDCTFNKRPP